MKSRKLNAQGDLDGLCGPYAITNALVHIGHQGDPGDLFQTACQAVSARRWPELLWEGTTFGDLKKMIAACIPELDAGFEVEVNYPFWRMTPLSNDAYWLEFDAIFDDEDVVCGIIGITRPSWHWLVVMRDGRRVTFLDSDPRRPTRRVNRSSLYAGERAPSSIKWKIDRRELIVFRRTS